MATDRVVKNWEVAAPPAFWSHLAWAAVELGRPEEEVAGSAIVLLVHLLREIRAGRRVVVLDGKGETVWELTAENMAV